MKTKRRSAATARARKVNPAPVERDLRGVLIRVNATGLRALRQLALDRDTTLQALGVEAFNDLLRKHGARAVVANPLHPIDAERSPR
jgi:antitoxin-like ribbon-helix-helix protein